MPDLPVLAKFFLNNRKVVILAVLKDPDPSKLKVVKTAPMLVRLPDDKCYPVVAGKARLEDLGGGAYKLLLAVLQYGANPMVCPRKEFGIGARLEITIKNSPIGQPPTDQPIIVDDTDPNPTGNPGMNGPIDLYA